jgi:hypothetical protein
MNSLSLKENGFADFVPLKGLSFSALPQDENCVLILVDSSLTGKPASDVLYIGKAKKPAKKVFGGYLAGYGGKSARKINSMLFNDGYLEKVSIGWMHSDTPKLAQQELLESFKKAHGDYPAWNISKKAPVVAQPKPKAPAKAAKPRPIHK